MNTQLRVAVVSGTQWRAAGVTDLLEAGPFALRALAASEFETALALDVPSAIVVQVQSDFALAEKVIRFAHQLDDNLPVIVVAKGMPLETAVACMKAGAHDVVAWPVPREQLEKQLEHATRLYQLIKRVFVLEQQTGSAGGRLDDMIGSSTQMREVFQIIKTVAPSNATVLITGESGTGKELVARALHNHSERAKHRFMDLNCGAIPHNLLENELFGHEKGAFTGAEKRYLGCCERAHQGTLFLDEICEMPAALQVKMLRMLQERSFMRVGGTEQVNVDLRFVAATNRNVLKEVEAGNFREDLYYRLNVVPLQLPALRERAEDIAPLARSFLERFAQRMNRPFVDFEPDALDLMTQYKWPGNVRELENIMERMVVLNDDTRIKVKHLPEMIREYAPSGERKREAPAMFGDANTVLPLDLVERYAIEAALEKCVGNVSEAARRLKIGQATLYRKIRQYGLRG